MISGYPWLGAVHMHISAIQPIDAAWKRMVTILFKPFAFKKWCVLGFCAFLSQCGEAGSNVNNFSNPGGGGGNVNGSAEFKHWVESNVPLAIGIGAAVVLLFIGLLLLTQWLNSRGKFMLIDGIVKNRAAIVEPWKEYKREGNSLFLFRIGLALIGLVLFIVLAAIPVLIAIPDMRAETFGGAAIASIGIGAIFLLLFIIAGVAINMFIWIFLIPTMYLRRVRAVEGCRLAWRELAREHVWPAVLLTLMIFLFLIAAGTIGFVATCLTCCIAALPYIGTVILLPIPVFLWAYILEYLQQYGDDWTFFPPAGNCNACGYDLSGNSDGSVCPECGTPTGSAKTIPATTD
jgi:hypothetical protein